MRRLITTCAATILLALAAPAISQASLLFNGDFETGDLSQWPLQQFCPDDITVYSADSQPTWPEPAQGTYAAQDSVADSHVVPYCSAPSGNPRGQIAGPSIGPASFHDGDARWESWDTYIPSGFPLVTGSNWFVLQQDYGQPFAGSPPVAMHVLSTDGAVNSFVLHSTQDKGAHQSVAWSAPIDYDQWHHFVVYKTFSTSDTGGAIKLWFDGARQRFADGSFTFHTRTLNDDAWAARSDITDNYRFYLNNYRADELSADTVTVYHDDAEIGTTRWDVEG